MAVLGIGLGEVNKILESVGEKVAPTSSSAYDILHKREADLSGSFLSTGISDLDALMNGGLPVGMITEIAGCPGSGKSQFCLGCLAEMVPLLHNHYTGSTVYHNFHYTFTDLVYLCTGCCV